MPADAIYKGLIPKWIREMDPDTQERIGAGIGMLSMGVKIMMASFPMLFVPQMCDDKPCSMGEKFTGWKYLMFMNFCTFGAFMNLYRIQWNRENYMIDFFDEDDDKAENYLTEEIKQYPNILKKITSLNKNIKFANNISIGAFLINTIYSSSFILTIRYLDSTTLTVLLTNSLLVQGKLLQIRGAYTCDDYAQSTVGTRPKVYNIIDVDKRHTYPICDVELAKLESGDVSPTSRPVDNKDVVIETLPDAPDSSSPMSPRQSPVGSENSSGDETATSMSSETVEKTLEDPAFDRDAKATAEIAEVVAQSVEAAIEQNEK